MDSRELSIEIPPRGSLRFQVEAQLVPGRPSETLWMMQQFLQCIEDTTVMKAVRAPCVEDLIDLIVPAILIFLSTELVHEVRLPGQHLFRPPCGCPSALSFMAIGRVSCVIS